MDKPSVYSHQDPLQQLGSNSPLLEKLKLLHSYLKQEHSYIDRIAIALYDAPTDNLKTFVWSSEHESPLTHYQARLSDSPSLLDIIKSGHPRIVNNMDIFSGGENTHTQVLNKSHFGSSYTFPMYQESQFIGFIFYNSFETEAFEESTLNDLDMMSHILSLLVSHEQDIVGTLQATVRSAMNFTHHRDPETAMHIDRMSRFSRLIASELAEEFGFDDQFIEHIFLFSPLHDIGKISIPDSVLLKPGKLSKDEFEVMKSHASKGKELIDTLLQNFSLDSINYIDILKNIAHHHHEAYDGSGYPDGLVAQDIPIEARIVAVADVFDALTSERPYKKAWSNEKAFATIQAMAGTKLDHRCVQALLNNKTQVEKIHRQFKENIFG